MDNYFTNYGHIDHYSERDKTILQIRDHINDSLLYNGDFSGVEGVLRGVLYSNRELCVDVITWESLWEQDRGTLLHEIMGKSPWDKDPPESLFRMVLDIAPDVIYARDVGNSVPLHSAIYDYDYRTGRSFDIIKMLVDADTSKSTISSDIIKRAVWRKDEQVMEYLLSCEKGRSALFLKESHYDKIPLYYASRDFDVEDGKLSSFLQFFIKACAHELVKQRRAEPPKCSCLIGAINTCQDYLYDAELLSNIAKKDKTLCCSPVKIYDL